MIYPSHHIHCICVYIRFTFLSCLFKIHRVRAECQNGLQDALDKPIDILHIRITINILAGVIFTSFLTLSVSRYYSLCVVVIENVCIHTFSHTYVYI